MKLNLTECLTQSRLIKIEREKLNKIFEKHLADGMLFFKRLARIIGQRLINSYIHSFLHREEMTNLPMVK